MHRQWRTDHATPRPGSHKYDIQRARLRDRHDGEGTADKRADDAANKIL
jgi:hypothetical protein